MKRTRKFRLLWAFAALTVLAALLLGWALSPAGPLGADRGEIRNIIVMIPDGGGFGSFDMAEAVKRAGLGIPGMSTQVTTDAIPGETVEGLYLSRYLVGTSVTYSADNPVTDSAAGGTAIATGKKTRNDVVALSPDNGAPMVSLLEASGLAGKATGLVCTKFWYDATPADFAAHAASRTEYDNITEQMLHQGLDIVLGGGMAESYSGGITAQSLGYTVVKDKTELERAVTDGAEKVWSSFSAEQGGSLPFDFQLSDGEPTLLEMTQAAIDLLSDKGKKGFFLMVEGSRVDSGGHNSNALQSSSEYLAFDEAFAYAVSWAMEDGHTLVIAVPDHDTGGLTPRNEAAAVQAISAGTAPEDCTWAGEGYHTGQNVPLCVYGPEKAVEELLAALGLPAGGAAGARSGKYHAGVEFDPAYAVDNTMIARSVAQVAKLDLTGAAKELFVDITAAGSYADGVFTVAETGAQIPENVSWYLSRDGARTDFDFGIAVYSGERFYIPRHAAVAVGALTEK